MYSKYVLRSYSYVYVFLLLVCSVLGILFHCVALCIVCVQMCTVLLPLGVYPIAVNKYIITSKNSFTKLLYLDHTGAGKRYRFIN